MAGAEGFEPPLAVLETAGLAVKPMPLTYNLQPGASSGIRLPTAYQKRQERACSAGEYSLTDYNELLSLPMRLMFPAIRTELFHLQAFRSRPLVLGLAVVAVLALSALKLNNFSRHVELSLLSLSSRSRSRCRRPQCVRPRELQTAALYPWPPA